MSYARFGWEGSDVYLIGSVYPGGVHVIECCGCIFTLLTAEVFPAFTTNEETLAHLDRHRAAGHTVPQSAYEEIKDDDWVTGRN